MASLLFAGCIRSWTRQQGSASNLLSVSRCCLPTCQQQCAQTVSGQGHIHTTSGSGQTRCLTSSSSSCLSSGVHCVASSQFVNLRHFRTTSVPCAKRDFYDVLGVSKTASDGDIKKAYYKLAKQYHPDSNKGDEKAQKKFQEVSEAYDTLKDSSKRSMYDRVGPEGMENMGGFDGAQGFGGFGGGGFRQASAEEINNIFSGMFGGGRGGGGMGGFAEQMFQQQRMRGPDMQVQMRISLKEAAEGVSRTMQIPTRNVSGQRESRSVKVDIPAGLQYVAGIETGQTIQLDGEGGPAAAKNGTAGNLFVEVNVAADKVLHRRGSNIHVTIDIDFVDAILGSDAKVPTLTGLKELSLGRGTQPGDRLRMRGLGMPILGGYGKGDQFVHVNVALPRSTTQRQRELLIEFQNQAAEPKAKAA